MRRVWARVADLRMLAAALPVSLSVRRALRSHRDLGSLLASLDAAASGRPPRRYWGAPARVPIVAGWCFRFTDRSCVGRSLTAFALLRRQGESPSFVSGVFALDRSDNETLLDGHAWVELDGSPLGDTDLALAARYREIYRHPPSTI
jgi:hypothetical protein